MKKQEKKIGIVNIIGVIFIIFLTVVKTFYSSQFSLITTGFGGLVCIIIGASLVFYKPKTNK